MCKYCCWQWMYRHTCSREYNFICKSGMPKYQFYAIITKYNSRFGCNLSMAIVTHRAIRLLDECRNKFIYLYNHSNCSYILSMYCNLWWKFGYFHSTAGNNGRCMSLCLLLHTDTIRYFNNQQCNF